MLYKYIFYRAYHFADKVLKEKEFPWAFASIMVTLCIATSIVVVLEIIEYLYLPERINIYGDYHGFFALALCVVILVLVARKGRYLKILQDCERMTLKKRRIIRVISVVYIVCLIVSFFLMAYLIKESRA
jgi:hypothetical protein